MGAALIGLTLGVAIGAALLYLGGRLRSQGKIAKVFGFFVSMYGAIMIAVSLYALLTLK